jgi:hypothetical protein
MFFSKHINKFDTLLFTLRYNHEKTKQNQTEEEKKDIKRHKLYPRVET